MSLPAQPNSRQIRVFVSSTFRDMQAERDYLVKFIFPQLRRLCESRGVVWGEVDLRWGVTDEQKSEGKVLPICLEEIRRCRPYFIGLLGERYGWIPDAIPDGVIEREPWLQEYLHAGKSVTELEILHGLVREEGTQGHGLFYFRDPAFIANVTPEQRQNFVSEDLESAAKLQRLKELIRNAQREKKCQLREGFSDPKALGELVLADLGKIIDDNWSEGSQAEPLDRDAMDHAAYAQTRERVYIGRQEYFDRLDTHAAAHDAQPLIILGESGCGKSALLANWVARYQKEQPGAVVLQHYAGATSYSADWAALVRRLMGEIKRRFGLSQEIPEKDDALRDAFPNWLHLAAAQGRLVIVIDALNQLEDRGGAPDLVWLPPVMPANVRLVASTLPGRALEEIRKRQWPEMQVQPLEPDARRQLIQQYLAQSAKNLSRKQLDGIINAPQCANPLYLRVLLDELRILGKHEELDERIQQYLEAESPQALYRKVIARWEADYGAGATLVGDILTLLWAARRGLSESELTDLLGVDGQPLPRAVWSPLLLAMSDSLVNRNGLLAFAHDFLRLAACDVYLREKAEERRVRLRLAAYFSQERSRTVVLRDGAEVTLIASDHFGRTQLGLRRADELPWQLAEAEAWQELFTVLSDGHALEALGLTHESELRRYWARLEEQGLKLADAYWAVLKAPDFQSMEMLVTPQILSTLSSLLNDLGHSQEALILIERTLEYAQKENDEKALAGALIAKAHTTRGQGDLDSSVRLCEQAQAIFLKRGDLAGTALAVENEAVARKGKGELERALQLQHQAFELHQKLGDRPGVMRSLGNQGVIHLLQADFETALALFRRQEALCKELGDQTGLEACFGNQAASLIDQGRHDAARLLLRQQERICRDLGARSGLATCLGNQAALLIEQGEHEDAMPLLEEQFRISHELGDQGEQSRALANQGTVWRHRGHYHRALEFHRRAAQIERELGNRLGLQTALLNQGDDYRTMGDLEMALSLYKDSELVSRKLGHPKGVVYCLAQQAGILWEFPERRSQATRMFKEAESLARQHGLHKWQKEFGEAGALMNDLLGSGDHQMPSAKGASTQDARPPGDELAGQGANVGIRIKCPTCGCFVIPKDQDLARTVLELGFIGMKCSKCGCEFFYDRIHGEIGPIKVATETAPIAAAFGLREAILGAIAKADFETAERLMAEHEAFCRTSKVPGMLEEALSWHGQVLLDAGQIDEAFRKFLQGEVASLESGNQSELANSLRGQGRAARRQNRLADAEQRTRKAIELFDRVGDRRSICGCLADLALVLEAKGDLAGALESHHRCQAMSRELGETNALQNSLGNQAAILADTGDIPGAVELLAEQADLCRRASDERSLAQAVLNQGILTIRGLHRLEDGLILLADGCRRCLQHQLRPPVEQALAVLRAAAAELLTPILEGSTREWDDRALRQCSALRQFAFEFRETSVFVWTTQALAQAELNRGASSKVLEVIESTLASCRQQGWHEPVSAVETLQSRAREIQGEVETRNPNADLPLPITFRFQAPEHFLPNASYSYWVVHPRGLTPVPCMHVVKLLSSVSGEIYVERDGETVNGKSIMGLMMLAAGPGSSLKISFSLAQDGHALDPLIQKGILAPDGAEGSYRCQKCGTENLLNIRQLPGEHACPNCGQKNVLRVAGDDTGAKHET